MNGRFNFHGDDCPGRKLIENASMLEISLWRFEDGDIELSYKLSGSIEQDDDATPIDPQQFARDLMAAFGKAKGGAT